MKSLIAIGVVLVVVVASAAIYVYSGRYDVAADSSDTTFVSWLLGTVSDRSVEAHAKNIQPPNTLTDETMLVEGAGHYAEMCAGCHLAPGVGKDAIQSALNPEPPRLALPSDLSAAEMFWVIKHGVKMSGMPAWGKSHSDQEIWAITAFVRRLPTLSAQGYQDYTTRARAAEASKHQEAHSG